LRIIQALRRRGGRAVTAAGLAAELEVSPRTVYGDIRDLQAQRVPIEGAAGVGYLLREGFDLPPVMFTADELDALVLGARIVASWADPVLAQLRRAVREQRKVRVGSTSEKGKRTERTLWPMALAFFPPVWLLLAWCELRQDFRSFRVDRVDAIGFAEERYPTTPGRRLSDFLGRERERRAL
jgi:predicted DNA-binding transcriptional regulator YafY